MGFSSVLVPSPSKSHAQPTIASGAEVEVSVKLTGAPSSCGSGDQLKAAVGPKSLTTRSNVIFVVAPSLSSAAMVTVWLSSGPSVVSNDQLQVPSLLSSTVPTDAVSVTSSSSGSEIAPVFVAVCPSSTVTVARSALMSGGSLTSPTLMKTPTTSETSTPSLTRYAKPSSPVKSGFGV